jgi:DUF4097 and DUF4098 domain-containing protein YvlB
MIAGSERTTWRAAAAAVCLVVASGCGLELSLTAEARDQWKRTYTLAQNGSFEIRNTNGKIDVRVGDNDQIEVTADRIVKAATDEAAKDALKRFEITETVSADHVGLDATSHGLNFDMHLSRRVDFVVRVPRWAAVKLVSTNGEINAADLGGALTIETTNGAIKGTSLSNTVSVDTTNGAVSLDMAKLGDGGVTCSTTNGKIEVLLPHDAKATISARVTNGAIDTSGLDLTKNEDTSRKRLDASMGGGGPNVRLETTNGLIAIRSR